MEYRRLGDSGLRVSVIGLGTNNFGRRIDEVAAVRVTHAAMDSGVTFFDTADIYGGGDSERFLGKAVKRRRDRVIVATKFGMPRGEGPYDRGGSRWYIRQTVEASLRRLDTDYIDLYQMHEPDPLAPIEETLSTLDDLVRDGKVRYVGCSNFDGWQIGDAAWTSRVRGWATFVSAQNHYSLLHRDIEREVVPACAHFGLGVIPFYPLAGGLLTGKYHRGEDPPAGSRLAANPAAARRWITEGNLNAVEALKRFADERGITLLQVGIGGLAAQPQVASVIAGATSVEQVRANVEAGLWRPTPDDLAEIDRIVPSPRHG